jgi:hypothetical protein
VPFRLHFVGIARNELQALEVNPAQLKRYKAVRSALGKLQINPRHPGLNTHKYNTKTGANGEDIFEAYAENNTPGAYRIFWHYGPGKDVITVVAITAHR